MYVSVSLKVYVYTIVPNIRVRPIYWTYANVCKRTRMIRDIRLASFFFFDFFLVFLIFDIHNIL